MTENLESIILEHLRHIRKKMDALESDMADMKARMNGIEHLQRAEFFHLGEVSARHGILLEKIVARLDRMETRLELHE